MNKNNSIGFLLGSLNGAGAEKTILTLAKNLILKGANVDLLLLSDHADYTAPEGINTILVTGKSKRLQRKSLSKITRAKKYDLFVTSRAEFYNSIEANSRYCSVHITPTAWLDKDISGLKKFSKIFKLKNKFKNKKLIALSEGIKSDLVNNLACRPEDVTIINNPFEINVIRQAAEQLGELPKDDYIVYVASFIKRKRHHDLIRAFASIKDKNIQLLFLGKGPEEGNLKKLAEGLGVLDRLIFWGWDENPYRLVKNAKLSILASEAEGLPRVLVESLSLQTPIISTDCPSGPNEVLIDELADFLVPVGDVAAMTQAIDEALQQYPIIAENFTRRFDASFIADKYLELI